MIILIKLLLAHMVGDFLLQPDQWVRAKETKKLRSWQLYVHAMIHLALIMLLVWDTAFIKWAILLALSHLFIDILKLFVQNFSTKRIWFFADQALHITFILIVWIISQKIVFETPLTGNIYLITLITFMYAITQPVSAIIRSVISRWSPTTGESALGSLENAGSYIGILERLLVFTFIITGNWGSVGFLLAAKSVFRFGDLKESKERMLTEYVMIGTFLSFGMAILAGIVFVSLNLS